jgi:DNA-binding MarR family transcriptional regulator
MLTRASVDVEAVTRLRTVVCRLSRRLNGSTPNVGLTPSQVSVLGSVGTNGPLAVTELAGLAGLNATMVSRIVGKLVAAGLIERAPDPDDRRAALISVTPAGRRLLVRIRGERQRVLYEGLEGMTEAEVAALFDALPALESLARRFGIAVDPPPLES